MGMRRRRSGELVIEQTRDVAAVRAFLERAGMSARGVDWPPACFVAAYLGDEPIGIVGVECKLDSALIHSLHVAEQHRRRGIGAGLVSAARKAAHTRGARMLYLFADPELRGFFERLGFSEVASERPMNDLRTAPEAEYYRAHPDELARRCALALDISNDGLIAR
ncbi:MAG TPA: GNAT family N-acetyltransferase [Candidatus Binataceae bacterium]|nr:GNAT family N-acetyltransferase [Candidatus Binataceae bacterium]